MKSVRKQNRIIRAQIFVIDLFLILVDPYY